MVDTYGRWTEEKDYTNIPEYKMCDYDLMAIWIRNKRYKPKTTMENLISVIFLHFDGELADNPLSEYGYMLPFCEEYTYVDCCKQYVEDSGGIAEFDYEV